MKTTIRKALAAAGGSLVFALGTAMADGDLTTKEGVISFGGALVVGATVWKLKYEVPA